MRKEQAMANIFLGREISLQCLNLSTVITSLQEGFLEGITGAEIEDHLRESLKILKNIIKLSEEVVEMKDKRNDRIIKVKGEVLDDKVLANTGLVIIGFLEIFEFVYENETREKISRYINCFFEAISECLDRMNEQLTETFETSKNALS